MSSQKKKIRQVFREKVFERDNYTCKTCGFESTKDLANKELDAHHITDRTLMIAGGYVKENGISLCAKCHEKAEEYHRSNHQSFHPGYHPDDLYALIRSSYEQAIKASGKIK